MCENVVIFFLMLCFSVVKGLRDSAHVMDLALVAYVEFRYMGCPATTVSVSVQFGLPMKLLCAIQLSGSY